MSNAYYLFLIVISGKKIVFKFMCRSKKCWRGNGSWRTETAISQATNFDFCSTHSTNSLCLSNSSLISSPPPSPPFNIKLNYEQCILLFSNNNFKMFFQSILGSKWPVTMGFDFFKLILIAENILFPFFTTRNHFPMVFF